MGLVDSEPYHALLKHLSFSAELVSAYAKNEQNFNAVERILYYTELPAEGAIATPSDPPTSWPHKGEIEFKNVKLSYRPGLPLVLKGVTFAVNPGEKVTLLSCSVSHY